MKVGSTEITVTEYSDVIVLTLTPGATYQPSDLRDITSLAGAKPVIIDGPGPIWLHSALAHAAHATPWVAHADPRQTVGGRRAAVVVQSHTFARETGELVAIPSA